MDSRNISLHFNKQRNENVISPLSFIIYFTASPFSHLYSRQKWWVHTTCHHATCNTLFRNVQRNQYWVTPCTCLTLFTPLELSINECLHMCCYCYNGRFSQNDSNIRWSYQSIMTMILIYFYSSTIHNLNWTSQSFERKWIDLNTQRIQPLFLFQKSFCVH